MGALHKPGYYGTSIKVYLVGKHKDVTAIEIVKIYIQVNTKRSHQHFRYLKFGEMVHKKSLWKLIGGIPTLHL